MTAYEVVVVLLVGAVIATAGSLYGWVAFWLAFAAFMVGWIGALSR